MQSAQQALSNEDASRTVKKVEISPKQFKDFKSFLNIIKSEFNDFSMVDGAFRSYCNDRWRKCIVETGFPFFTDISFTVCNIKTFLKSISTHGEKFPVNVTVTESKITFEDLYGGNIEFLTANPEHSDNPFISNDDLDSTFLANVDTEKLMVKDAVPQVVVSKLKLMRGKLSSKHICINHDENDLGSGFLSISNRSEESIKTQRILSSAMIDIAEYGVRLNRPFLIPMKKNHFFNLDILPTLFNKDDLYIKCYLTDDEKIFAILNTKVNDLFVNIYLESKLCGETEVPLEGSVKKSKGKSKEKRKRVTKAVGTGTQEWSIKSINCCSGCSHDCRYCYAKEKAIRCKQLTANQWPLERIRPKDVTKRQRKYDGQVMFPSSHDITPNNFDACLTVLKNLLDAGNRVLVVSKPHLNCITAICEQLKAFKEQILFRFTIGACDDRILSYWEPNAPAFDERKTSLIHAYESGFQTSISMEPMLDAPNIDSLISELLPYVTNAIWIGKMNHLGRFGNNGDAVLRQSIENIKSGQSDDAIKAIYSRHRDNPKIKWKKEIKKVVGIPLAKMNGMDM
jgi:hypothetical protein